MEWGEGVRVHLEGKGWDSSDCRYPLMCFHMFLQVILPAETFATHGTREWPESGMYPLVTS